MGSEKGSSMPSYIVHHKGLFFEFSTITDTPVSYVMPRDQFEDWYRDKYGSKAMPELEERMKRALAKGTSSMDDPSAYATVSGNRADDGRRHLSLKQILIQYRRPADDERTAGEQIAALKTEILRLRETGPDDTRRLDFLDACNARLNEHFKTEYGWEFILSHNVTRLMSARSINDIDLNDALGGHAKLKSCRDAIDRRMLEVAANRTACAARG